MKKTLLSLIFACSILSVAKAQQIISTVAGIGTSGFAGDNGAALAASIDGPSGIAFDTLGNMYVSEWNNHVIRKVTPSGIITSYAGMGGVSGYGGDNGPATAALLNRPIKIFMDSAQNLYIAEYGNNRIRKVNAAGVITTVAGTGSATYNGDGIAATTANLDRPNGVYMTHSGELIISDCAHYRIRKVNASGIISTIAGTGVSGYSGNGVPATTAQLDQAFGVTADRLGNIYIGDGLNNRVRKISPAGIITTIAGNGTAGSSGDGGPATAALVYNAVDAQVDDSGNVYIADQLNYKIRKINAAGIISTVAGTGTVGFFGDRGLATNAKINQCNDIEVSKDGKIYITDNNNNRVRVIYSCSANVTTQPVNDTISATAGGVATFHVNSSAILPTFQWQKYTGPGYVNLTNTAPYSGVYTSTLSISIADNSLNLALYRCIVFNDSTCADTSTAALLRVYGGVAVENVNATTQPSVYPNPSTGNISISLQGTSGKATLAIYNLYGSAVMEKTLRSKETSLDISDLPPAVYIFKFIEDNNSYSVKVIKQ